MGGSLQVVKNGKPSTIHLIICDTKVPWDSKEDYSDILEFIFPSNMDSLDSFIIDLLVHGSAPGIVMLQKPNWLGQAYRDSRVDKY